jgi:hypothetical protein
MTPAIIIALINGAMAIIQLVPKWVSDLKQNAELTPEEEAALDAAIASIGTKPYDVDTGK